MFDERDDAAFVLELVALSIALVVERDENAAVEKRELSEPLRERVEAIFDCLEDLRVCLEGHLRAAALRRACLLKGGNGSPALVTLLIDVPVSPDLEIEALG